MSNLSFGKEKESMQEGFFVPPNPFQIFRNRFVNFGISTTRPLMLYIFIVLCCGLSFGFLDIIPVIPQLIYSLS